MTVMSTTRTIDYTGDGSTYIFPYTFKVFSASNLVVTHTDTNGVSTTWVLDTHYTVTGVGNYSGGNVVVTKTPTNYTPAKGATLSISRVLTILQESDYIEDSPFHASTLEDDLDKGIMIDQQLSATLDRAIIVPASDLAPALTLPVSSSRANKILKFDSNGDVGVSTMADADLIDSGSANQVVIYTSSSGVGPSAVTISAGVITATGGNSTQWNTAYGWGNHTSGGYVKADGSVAFSAAQIGVAPSSDLHLSTKKYVDDEISTLSGSIVLDHGGLTGLSDDDHSQYHNDTRGDIRYHTKSQITTISGDIVAQIPSDYISDTEMTVISGDIVGKIPDVSNFITDTEVATISGDITDQLANYVLTDGSKNITGQFRFEEAVIIDGNLTVSGTTFTTAVENVLVEDNLITVNYGETASGVTSVIAGIEVDRGTDTNYWFVFDEADDNFQVGVSGSMQAVATREDTPTANGLAYWNSSDFRFDTSANYTTTTIVTESELTTASGDIVLQIPSLSGYATEEYVATVSGDIVLQFPSDFYTQAEVTTISGDIINKVTYETLNTNGDVGTSAGQLAIGNHTHATYLTDIVNDTSPQLGGDLDVNAHNIYFGNTVISGTASGVIVTGGHGTATHAEVVNVVYGTGSAPTISGSNITEGTLFIKYTA